MNRFEKWFYHFYSTIPFYTLTDEEVLEFVEIFEYDYEMFASDMEVEVALCHVFA
jgi:hypothetical protein